MADGVRSAGQNTNARVEYIDGVKYEWNPKTVAHSQCTNLPTNSNQTPDYYECLNNLPISIPTIQTSNVPLSIAPTISSKQYSQKCNAEQLEAMNMTRPHCQTLDVAQ